MKSSSPYSYGGLLQINMRGVPLPHRCCYLNSLASKYALSYVMYSYHYLHQLKKSLLCSLSMRFTFSSFSSINNVVHIVFNSIQQTPGRPASTPSILHMQSDDPQSYATHVVITGKSLNFISHLLFVQFFMFTLSSSPITYSLAASFQ